MYDAFLMFSDKNNHAGRENSDFILATVHRRENIVNTVV